MATNIQEAKATLRQQIKKTLSNMSIEDKLLQSKYVTNKILQHRRYLMATRIGIYLNLPDELQTDHILKHLFSVGKECFIPRYSKESMDMVKMIDFEERNSLPKTKWHIPQPLEGNEREEAMLTGGLDLLIIPGRAFSKNGHRLGRGKGYYDRYLERYKEQFQGKLPYTIGVAFAQQMLASIPCDEKDAKLDEVIFDNREPACIS